MIKVNTPDFRQLVLAAARALEESPAEVPISADTLDDLHFIVYKWHPEPAIKDHFAWSRFQEIIK